ncbi:hypothetical protein FRC09_009156 [Ceratobasidium sp. 395]|nr:hypothetical protein FRC09_009156 [Ceratobasidium sp. 395]
MSSVYASPPNSARATSPRSPQRLAQSQPRASTSKAAIDSSIQALSQPPPPTLRDILSAYASRGQGDRDMLIALLNAKAAEEARIAAVATLQQNVLQMQMSVAAAQLRQQQEAAMSEPRSPVSPSPPTRISQPSNAQREVSPSVRARKDVRTHPYARRKEDESVAWAPRRSWDAVSDERSTSEDGA